MNDFGNKIKLLRKERDLTQEELSEILGVSFQTISKWETNSAMPDISMLPIIANYFEVTTDELLGVDNSKIKQKINAHEEKINQLYHEWRLDDGIKLARQVLKEYPNSYQIMILLGYGLWHLGLYDELIELTEKILEKDTNTERRNKALEYLIHCHSRKGNRETALKLANQLPSFFQSKQHTIINNNLKSESEKYKYIGLVINGYLSIFEKALEKFADVWCIKQYLGESPLTIDDRIEVIKKIINIYRIIFEEEDYMIACAEIYYYYETISILYLMKSDKENALDNLEKAYEFVEKFHSYSENDCYTSILFKGLNPSPQSTYNRTMFESMYEYLLNSNKFDIIKGEQRFQNIVKQLALNINK